MHCLLPVARDFYLLSILIDFADYVCYSTCEGKHMVKKGFFITVEGIDGCGKTTQINKLKEYFESKGLDVLFTREPGGVSSAEKIREILLDKQNTDISPIAEMLLFAASRAIHLEQRVLPALKQGKIVVCDRFIDSSICYQGYGRGLGISVVKKVNKVAIKGTMPDLTILLDIPASVGAERNRAHAYKKDRMEIEGVAFEEKVRAGYLKEAASNSDRFLVVDATKSIDEIFNNIIKGLKSKGIINA